MRTFLALAAVVLGGCATIDAAPPHQLVTPNVAAVPRDLGVCWVEYGRKSSWGQLATAGFGDHPTFHTTVAGLIIKHPKKHILLDAGASTSFEAEIADVPFFTRQYLDAIPGSIPRVNTAPDAIRAIGEDPASIGALLVSHVHADHLGGVLDLPKDLPVWMSEDEVYFLQRNTNLGTFHVLKTEADAIVGRVVPLHFSAVPYETFDRSLDLFGDGSVVLVPLPGHTPGSIGTFVNIPGKRLFHVGDTAWASLQIDRRVGKSAIAAGTDVDHDATNRMVAKLAALRLADPALTILPAHDRDGYEKYFGGAPKCVSAAPP